ncbi:gamma-tubulin complex component 6 isoform X2 [Tanacetum coccineum]|uniref:Gamma-tubulin complex component 6 isoform X2 n=1 Tax=Tanacetum coccineum TaxID=301880 RepID=A0ABQ5CR51_9ASTR
MAVVDTDLKSILNNLKLQDPYYLPPRPWESIPSESGPSDTSSSSTSRTSLYATSSVSEASLVRLAMNALQGLESSLISIDKLCKIFRSDPTDRTFHRIPSLWNQSVSTLALEKILTSLGCMGCEVFFLRKFINHFANLNWDDATLRSNEKSESEAEASDHPPYSLVNQAFAVAVGDILEGYIAALDTISSSVALRRSSNMSSKGCLSSVAHSEVTLLEVYLHTKELRNQIEVIGSICNVHNVARCFSLSPLEDLDTQTKFSDFPRGGNLLTYLYMELKVADPTHCALFRTLFVRSCEPYFDFIRSWIFKAKITDPFSEFIVAEAESEQSYSLYNTGVVIDFPSATIREQVGVSVPCFLRDFLIPLLRAGQQLQVLIKLLEFSDGVGSWNRTYEDFLPYWNRMSSSRLSHAFDMAFTKAGIEMMVLARRDYYKIMMEKLKNHLPNLEFKYHQVIPYTTLPTSGRGSLEAPSAANGRPVSPSAMKTDQLPLGTAECDASSMTEDSSYLEDPWNSSECSSIENYGEKEPDISEKMVNTFHDSEDLEKKYLSALEIKSYTSSKSPSTKRIESHELSKNEDLLGYSLHPQHPWMNVNSLPIQNLSCTMEAQYSSDQFDSGCPLEKSPICNGIGNVDDAWFNASGYKSKYDLSSEVQEKNTSDCGDASSLRSLTSWEGDCANLILGTSKLRKRCSKFSLPSFDFKSVKDPFTECVNRLGSSDRGDQYFVTTNNAATMKNYHVNGHGDEALTVKKNSFHTHAPHVLNSDRQEQAVLQNVSGGGCWESLLDGTENKGDIRPVGHKTGVAEVVEIPLDFVLEKCLLEEIQLQYKYVSKLTIKLLEEGFSLQEHLLALRRYHMMESADWADLFIVSLWQHKWYATETDKRISDIQGLLELAVQKSSCERDNYKDRLFVYMKEEGTSALPGFATGIQSFNVLGLGYKVDWPVSIVLTPGALKIYAQIFSFLIQVKLALSSLTEVWCSFKEFIHFSNQDRHSDLRKLRSSRFNNMVKLRHQLFHFVSTLQQYVQSQLSHVSWCRFLQSLKHKVKDLTDLDIVHMDYLNDSRCICFLSNDMKQVAEIMQSILQCALDFRSVVVPNMSSAKQDRSLLNVAQVQTIKEAFDQNIRQLYTCYRNSPKNVEFSLPRFWEYLNYNDHYSDVISKELGHNIFSF